MSPISECYKWGKHELRMAWRRYQLRCPEIPSGLGEAGWALHGLVRAIRPENCVEIGTAHGYSTCLTALALEQNMCGRLWAVDPHLDNHWSDPNASHSLDELQRNLRRLKLQHRVTILRHTTQEAEPHLPGRIDFAFVDGDHSYEGVKTDWKILLPRMSEYGIIAFHDSLWDRNKNDPFYQKYKREGMGVPAFLESLRQEGYPLVTLPQNWGLTLVQPTRHGLPLVLPQP